MRKNVLLVKGSAFFIILLLLGTTLGQVVAVDSVKLSITRNNTTSSASIEKSNVTCRYFTLRGVEEVQKEISLQDSHQLSALIDGSDAEAVACELKKLGLAPSSMSSEQVESLLSGEYSNQAFAIYYDKLTSIEADKEVKQNFFCTVKGEAGSYLSANLREELLGTLIAFPALALILLDLFLQATLPNYRLLWQSEIFPGIYFGFGLVGTLGLLLFVIAEAILTILEKMPVKLSVFQGISLEESYNGPYVHVNTTGAAGNWS
jgi:hypothetical protein